MILPQPDQVNPIAPSGDQQLRDIALAVLADHRQAQELLHAKGARVAALARRCGLTEDEIVAALVGDR